MSYTQTPYVPYGTAPSYFKEIERLERERNELLRKSGLTPATNSLQDGRLVGKVPGTNTKYVYDNGEWKRTFGGGGIKKLQKTRCAKNAPRVQKNVDIHIIKILQQNVAAAEQTKNKKY